jgi:hypothetical protein
MRLMLVFLVLIVGVLPASAAKTERWYLRYATDNGPMARVYRSKAACEAGMQDMKRLNGQLGKFRQSVGEKEYKRLNPFSSKVFARNPRCSNRLPYGFQPPG